MQHGVNDNICQVIGRTLVVCLNRIPNVYDEETRAEARRLAELVGVFCGVSSGAWLHGAGTELFS